MRQGNLPGRWPDRFASSCYGLFSHRTFCQCAVLSFLPNCHARIGWHWVELQAERGEKYPRRGDDDRLEFPEHQEVFVTGDNRLGLPANGAPEHREVLQVTQLGGWRNLLLERLAWPKLVA